LRILVLGIGNPILRDDGIGPRVIEELNGRTTNPDIILAETSLAGMSLVEILSGYTHTIIIDAIPTGSQPGTLYRVTADSFQPGAAEDVSQHNIGILEALQWRGQHAFCRCRSMWFLSR
jgi:hydrogenase maturation protease